VRVLVSGAAGFIGSYVTRYLLAQGVDVLATSRRLGEATRRQLAGASFLELDVTAPDLGALRVEADAIVHVATANDIVSRTPSAGILLSSVGTKNLLDLAVTNGISKFVCFSTFQVYGTELQGTITESSPLRCENDYGLNHVFAEQYVEMYSRLKQLVGVVLRPANVYGAISSADVNRWSLVPACFCRSAFREGKITMLSSGRQRRDFVSLEDVSRAVHAVLLHFPSVYEEYNVATGHTTSIREVAELVREIYQQRYEQALSLEVLSDTPLQANDFRVAQDKLRSLGYEPDTRINLKTEIDKIFTFLETVETRTPQS
jgi:UDP-glucose 4-epimerase